MYIDHDRSVGGFVSRIYRRILRKIETKLRGADMITRACPRTKVKEASAMLSYSPVPREMAGSVVLVLVFAATRRQLALRAARVTERAGRHVEFFEIRFVKASYTV